MRRAIRRAVGVAALRPTRTENVTPEEFPMATMVDKPKQPKPAPQPADTSESARSAVQQSMDRRW